MVAWVHTAKENAMPSLLCGLVLPPAATGPAALAFAGLEPSLLKKQEYKSGSVVSSSFTARQALCPPWPC